MRDFPTKVSVIIPSAGHPAMLAEALRSVRALEGSDLELTPIVIDDGNDVRTEAVAAGYGARYIRATSHGPAGARNAGLRAASGDFIAFLDDDDRWLPGHLRPHIRVMRERPEVGAVFGQVVSYDSSFEHHTAAWPDPFPAGRTGFARVFGYQPQIGATVVRSSVVDSVGYFDEALLGDEDWDWQLRLALIHAVEFIGVPSVAYRCRPDGQTAADEINWKRLPYFDTVFWRNALRAGRARPPWAVILRGYLRIRGQVAAGFLSSAQVHSMAGDRRAARRQLVRGFLASPIHSLLWFWRKASARRTFLHAMAFSGGRDV